MINSFDGKYRFLSNFYKIGVFTYNEVQYDTTENAFQASKTLDKLKRLEIADMTPGQSKRAGREVEMRSDWDVVKLQVMEDILTIKFNQPKLRELLLVTGDEELIEGNTWNDIFWGVCDGVGENHLGKILMKIRSRLNKEDES